MGCGLRFASREKAIFGQPQVGAGLIPGGGALQRLPLLVGRARALEIVLGADDYDAETAERYDWINRAVPDAELDAHVANLVRRILSFEKRIFSVAKATIGKLPSAGELKDTQDTFFKTFAWEGFKRAEVVPTRHRQAWRVRPLHPVQLSLRFRRRRCDGERTIRRDRCQASRGQQQSSVRPKRGARERTIAMPLTARGSRFDSPIVAFIPA
jgi:hypothetical protein